ncbi:MAG: hypothetical protein Q4D53_06065 [Leptotrichiaceae bacterium]|nr:hypothetical protein [Leptotrichiaceae bacterium]
MKKYTVILLGIILLITACGGENKNQEQNQNQFSGLTTEQNNQNTQNTNTISNNMQSADSPQGTFENLMKMIQSGSMEEFQKAVPEGNAEQFAMFLEGYKNLTYTINGSNINGSLSTINISAKYPNLAPIVAEFQNEIPKIAENFKNKSQEEAAQALITEMIKHINSRIAGGNVQYIEKTMDIKYQKNGNSWMMTEDNTDFASMLTLGMN